MNHFLHKKICYLPGLFFLHLNIQIHCMLLAKKSMQISVNMILFVANMLLDWSLKFKKKNIKYIPVQLF